MNTSKIIKGVVGNGKYTVTASIVKEDYGLYLKIEGIELPPTYQVDFSNDEHSGSSVTMIGNADGVRIPAQFIKSGKDVFAFLYHVGADFGRTVYKFRIPNKVRPDRTNEEPTPEEQSVIDQCISALNEAVAQTAQDVASADQSAQSAQGYAKQAETARDTAQTYANNAQTSANNASASASQASASASASANSASQAEQTKTAVEDMVDDAQGYANSASQSASQASASEQGCARAVLDAASAAAIARARADEASGYAQTASNKATEASGYAQTASGKATEASQSATTASNKASEASGYATSAQTAQGLAEGARDNAIQAKTDAESARDEAVTAKNAVQGSADQIAQNAEDVSDLKEGLNDLSTVMTDNLVDKVEKINLYNKNSSEIEEGYYFAPAVTAGASYSLSGYISAENGKSYSWFSDANALICLYDSSKAYIGYIRGNALAQDKTHSATVNNANCAYVRFSYKTASKDGIMFVEGSTYPQTYYPYIEEEYYQLKGDIDTNPLYGKKVGVIGDSIMYGEGYKDGAIGIIASKNSMALSNKAVSGAKITITGSTASIYNQLAMLDTDCDYIIFDGGINDMLDNNLGVITSGFNATYDEATFSGSFEKLLHDIVATFPTKKIGYVSVHRLKQWEGDSYSSYANTGYYTRAMEILAKWGIPVCDLTKGTLSLYENSALKSLYTKNEDGWHPNENGYKLFYVDKIEAWMKTL